MDFLAHTSVGEYMKNFSLISINETDTVADVLQTFSENGISSAPLVDSTGTICKAIDMLDLVSYCTAKLDLLKKSTQKSEKQQIKEFLSKEIKNLADFSNRNPFQILPARKSLKKALRLLSYPNTHRIYLEEHGVLLALFTQSKAIEILLEHRKGFEETFQFRVGELFPEARQAKEMFYKEPLLAAFERIHQARVSGLAVVNEKGELVGNISASDLKYARFNNPVELFEELKSPIESFFGIQEGIPFWL